MRRASHRPGESGIKGITATCAGSDKGRETLGEDAPGTNRNAIEEAAGMNQEHDGAPTTGQVGDATAIASCGRRTRTDGRAGNAPDEECEVIAVSADARYAGRTSAGREW